MAKVLAILVAIVFISFVLRWAFKAGARSMKKRKKNRNGRI